MFWSIWYDHHFSYYETIGDGDEILDRQMRNKFLLKVIEYKKPLYGPQSYQNFVVQEMYLLRNKWEWDEEDFKKVRKMCHELVMANTEFLERDQNIMDYMRIILTKEEYLDK